MRLLALGDIFGRSGRDAITTHLPEFRRKMDIDFVIANGENATQGRGITPDHANILLQSGIDCLTLGDHAFDQRHLQQHIQTEPRIVRPLNFAKGAPGKGSHVFVDSRGRKILVMAVLGRVFMKSSFDDPFAAVKSVLNAHPLGKSVAATVIDMHGEATSEKNGMGLFCDGQATLVFGTHTHVPTADQRILPRGTAYITDVGMCGDYDSIIGMQKEEPLHRFRTGMSKERFVPASGPATLCGVIVDCHETGLAKTISPVRMGGCCLLPSLDGSI